MLKSSMVVKGVCPHAVMWGHIWQGIASAPCSINSGKESARIRICPLPVLHAVGEAIPASPNRTTRGRSEDIPV